MTDAPPGASFVTSETALGPTESTSATKEHMMTQYFLSLPHDSEEEPTMESMDPAELQEVIAQVEAFNTALQETGAFRFAGGLQPPSTATTVDATGGGPELTPGPFAEAKEYLGGFWVIEADNDDDAIAWAKQASRALQSRVEVRALQEAPSA
jgi:hypothetical protein